MTGKPGRHRPGRHARLRKGEERRSVPRPLGLNVGDESPGKGLGLVGVAVPDDGTRQDRQAGLAFAGRLGLAPLTLFAGHIRHVG